MPCLPEPSIEETSPLFRLLRFTSSIDYQAHEKLPSFLFWSTLLYQESFHLNRFFFFFEYTHLLYLFGAFRTFIIIVFSHYFFSFVEKSLPEYLNQLNNFDWQTRNNEKCWCNKESGKSMNQGSCMIFRKIAQKPFHGVESYPAMFYFWLWDQPRYHLNFLF